MNKSKIKNFIIIVLSILNLSLLSIVVSDYARSSAADRLAERRLAEVLGKNGILLSENVRIGAQPPALQNTRRDVTSELRLVGGILGDTELIDEGGNIYTYISDSGRAYFRGTGEFVIEPTAESVSDGGSIVSTGSRLLNKMGISFDRAFTETRSDSLTSEAVFVCSVPGGTVFNCRITFIFANGYLIRVEGRRAPDITYREEHDGLMDAATALLRFIDIIRENGYICSEIENIQAGYALSAAASGEGMLIPVWRVLTDTGEYYINSMSGKIEIM